jgi:acetylornithine deacetylase
MLWSVIDEEEGGGGGTLACLMEGYTASGMVCTEPHNLSITIAHAGVSHFRITVEGKTSHAGLAHLGVNAIGKMYPIYQALVNLDEKRGREIIFPLFEKGSGRSCHINVGTMKAGDWPSTVAGMAQIEGRIGFIPGEKLDDMKQMIESTVEEIARRDPGCGTIPHGLNGLAGRMTPGTRTLDIRLYKP